MGRDEIVGNKEDEMKMEKRKVLMVCTRDRKGKVNVMLWDGMQIKMERRERRGCEFLACEKNSH